MVETLDLALAQLAAKKLYEPDPRQPMLNRWELWYQNDYIEDLRWNGQVDTEEYTLNAATYERMHDFAIAFPNNVIWGPEFHYVRIKRQR